MKLTGRISRLLAIFVMIVALIHVSAPTLAQDTGELSVAEEASPSYGVDVSCWPAGDGSQSTCSFTGYASDGAAIEALWVPAWIACAPVADAGGSTWTGDGYHVEANSLSLTFDGAVSAGGGAGYMVRVAGSSVPADGSALVCSAATTTAEETTTDPSTEGDGNEPVIVEEPVDDTPTQTEPDPGVGEGSAPSSEGTEEAGGSEGSSEAEGEGSDAGNAIGDEGENSTGSDDSESDTPTEGSENEESEPSGPVGDGSAPSGVETPSTTVQTESKDVSPADVDVDVTVEVFNCDIDPGASDPATLAECTLAEGVTVTASENAGAPAADTTVGGQVTFSVPTGTSLTVTVEAPADYLPLGSGSTTFPVTEPTTLVFVNVLEESGGEPQLGRLQLVHGSCPTTQPRDAKFVVVPPRSFRTAATTECGPTPFAVLTITGGTLPAGGIQAVTDDNGVWRGYLPAGEYTVTVDSGSQGGVPVVADELTAVVVIEYSVPANGSLTITRTVCTVGDQEGTELIVSNQEIDTSGEGCGPANGQFMLTDLSDQQSIEFSLGNDGISTQQLPVGTYNLTDLTSGQDTNVTISEGASTFVAVRSISLYGTLVVRHNLCDDEGSTDQDPSNSGYFESNCRESNGGVAITLYNDEGNAVDTKTGSGGGVVTWQQVEPGTYTLETAYGLCAAFVDGVNASGGFDVEPGSTTVVTVYTCIEPNDGGNNGGGDDDDDTGDDDDGGNNGGGDDDGDDDTADDDDGYDGGSHDDDSTNDDEEVAAVTALPNTGAASPMTGTGASTFGLIALAVLVLLAAAIATRRRMI